MCGIIGYTGYKDVVPILLHGLNSLEYRGYDSAGVALQTGAGLEVIREKGKVSALCAALERAGYAGVCAPEAQGAGGGASGNEAIPEHEGCANVKETAVPGPRPTCGIGHTRWATHGKPSVQNAHPHTSCDGKIAIVHNGIIENFAELRAELEGEGHTFKSETDSEVLAHLIERAYKKLGDGGQASSAGAVRGADGAGDASETASDPAMRLLRATREALTCVVGAYALCVTCTDAPDVIVVTRKDSPLIVGVTGGTASGAEEGVGGTKVAARGGVGAAAFAANGTYVASDVIAFLDATRDVVVLDDGLFGILTPVSATFFDNALNPTNPEITHIDWSAGVAEKGGYPDFMMKEIYEQPRVIRDTLAGRLVGDELKIDELNMSAEELNLIDRVYIIACGTSYHAGLIAKNLIEAWARIPCEVEVASEFRYRNPIITATTLCVAVSQSGETADTLAAIRDARVKGARVFGITNVVGSPVARESDGVIYTKANKEIAVASTKSFLGQVVSLTLLSMLLAQTHGTMRTNQLRLLFSELAQTAAAVEHVLADTKDIDAAADVCAGAHSAMFIGRGMGSAIACEGALKLKEISYLHAESYPAGEMKHGPIALLDDGFPVIALATKSPTYDKVISNLQEARARGACILAVATAGDEEIKKHADHVIYVPSVRDEFSAIVASVPLQLLARRIAILRNCNVDQPRNLAKSVTVE